MRQGPEEDDLELGGNAPFIVFDDADFEDAVAGIVSAKLRNSGQVCIWPNCIYVQSGIHDRFVAAVKKKVAELRVDRSDHAASQTRSGYSLGYPKRITAPL